MDIQKKQQEVIKELRAEVAALTNIAKNRKETADRYLAVNARLYQEGLGLKNELSNYKFWTHLQLVILVAVAVKEVVQLINGA